MPRSAASFTPDSWRDCGVGWVVVERRAVSEGPHSTAQRGEWWVGGGGGDTASAPAQRQARAAGSAPPSLALRSPCEPPRTALGDGPRSRETGPWHRQNRLSRLPTVMVAVAAVVAVGDSRRQWRNSRRRSRRRRWRSRLWQVDDARTASTACQRGGAHALGPAARGRLRRQPRAVPADAARAGTGQGHQLTWPLLARRYVSPPA